MWNRRNIYAFYLFNYGVRWKEDDFERYLKKNKVVMKWTGLKELKVKSNEIVHS
jgi:hypothetical protein